MSALKSKPKFLGPRWTEWAYDWAINGGAEYDSDTETWVLPIEWEDSIRFPELKTVSQVFVRENRGEVFAQTSPF